MEIKVTTADLVSVAEAAKQLGLARYTIYRWVDAGKILAVRLGGILFIPKSEVQRLKNAQTNSTKTE